MGPFVIVGGQRSGSSFLVKLLDGHPQIRCAEEYFLLHWRDDCSGVMRIGPFAGYCRTKPLGHRLLRTYIKSKGRLPILRKVIELSAMDRWVDRFLDDRMSHTAPPRDALRDELATGFKMIYLQLERFPRVHDWIRRNDALVIHLVRENILRMHVSDLRAKQTGVHHLDQPMEPGRIEVPVEGLLEALQGIEEQRAKHRQAILGHRMVEVCYERLAEDPTLELMETFKVLGLESAELPEPAIKRLNPRSLEETTSNFDEVAAELEGTRFQKFLEG